MREIKFRAWYNKDNQMLSWSDLTQSAWNTFRGDTPLSLVYEILVARKNDFNTMQFTGLKDKNGKDIYEGDIVMHGIIKAKSKVEFIEGSFALNNEKTMRNTCIRHYALDALKVIGNIHENPELIK